MKQICFACNIVADPVKLALNRFCELNFNVMGSSHPNLSNGSYWVVLLHEGGRKEIVTFQNDMKLQLIVSWCFSGSGSKTPIDIF